MMDNETSSKLLEFTLQFIQAGHAVLSQFKIESDCNTTTIILQFQNNLDTPLPTTASLESLQSASDQQSTKETYSNEVPTESLRSNFCDNATNSNSANMCFEVNGTNKDLVIEQLSQLMHKHNEQATTASGSVQQQHTNNHSSEAAYGCNIKQNNRNKANQLKGGEENCNNESSVLQNANELVAQYRDSDPLDIEKVMTEILIESSFQQMCQDAGYSGQGSASPEYKRREVSRTPRAKKLHRKCDVHVAVDAPYPVQNNPQLSGYKCQDGRHLPASPYQTESKYLYPDSSQAMSLSPTPSPVSPSTSAAFCYSIPEEPELESGGKQARADQKQSKYPVPLSPTIKTQLARPSSTKSHKSRQRQRTKDTEQSNNGDSDTDSRRSDTDSRRSDTASVRTDEDYDTMDTRSSHSSRSTASSKSTGSAARQRLGAAGRRNAFSAVRPSSHHGGTTAVTSFSSSIGTLSNPGDTTLNAEEEEDNDDDKDSDAGGDDFELLSDLSKQQKQEKKQFRKQKSIFGIWTTGEPAYPTNLGPKILSHNWIIIFFPSKNRFQNKRKCHSPVLQHLTVDMLLCEQLSRQRQHMIHVPSATVPSLGNVSSVHCI